jgi:phosphonate transport system substrate-binding protein
MPKVGRTGRRRFLGAAAGTAFVATMPRLAFATEKELRIGLTPVFLTSDLELLARLRAYLERATGQPVKLITRRTYQEITSLLISGQLDAAWICGYPFVANEPQLALVAVPIWRGLPLYQSYLIAGADRAAAGIADLKSDIHAFSDPDSNSGWLVTATVLARMGTVPGHFFSQTFFTYGHRNVIRAVSAGLAMSGSVDGYVYDVVAETEPELVRATRVVRKSELLGFPPIACAAGLSDTPSTHRLREAFAHMKNDADGQTVLSMLRLDGFAMEENGLFDPIADEMRLVRGMAG